LTDKLFLLVFLEGGNIETTRLVHKNERGQLLRYWRLENEGGNVGIRNLLGLFGSQMVSEIYSKELTLSQ
jgi:hypothetical protein